MEMHFVNKNYLKGYQATFKDGIESVRFYNDKYMLKFIEKKYLKTDRQLIIEKTHEFDHEHIVKPEFGLYDKTGFLGYGMNYIKNYDYLDSVVDNDFKNSSTTFSFRKELMLELCDIFDYFNKYNFAYYDIYGKNILYKDGDIKLIDLDGGVFKGTNNRVNYSIAYRLAQKNLALYTLSFLYNKDIFEFLSDISSLKKKDLNSILTNVPEEVKNLFYYTINNDYHTFNNITQSIDSISQSMYEETNDKIIKKLTL